MLSKYSALYSYDKNGNIKTLNRTDGQGVLFDVLQYAYATDNYGNEINRLDYVEEQNGSTQVEGEITAGTHNYIYDPLGQLHNDLGSNIEKIHWDVYNKITQVDFNYTQGSQMQDYIKFRYDGMGNRISKEVSYGNEVIKHITYYTRDAQGNFARARFIYTRIQTFPEVSVTISPRHFTFDAGCGTLSGWTMSIQPEIGLSPVYRIIATFTRSRYQNGHAALVSDLCYIRPDGTPACCQCAGAGP